MGFLSRLFGGDKRNRRLAEWGKTVPLTSNQQEAMWKLYQSMQNGIIPQPDPLESLDDDDREYIMKICSSNFRPEEFGNADALRLAVFRDLKTKDYSVKQSAVLVGMMFNMVGRKDL